MLATGEVRTATSDENGEYAISSLAPGLYEVKVERQWLSKTYVRGSNCSLTRSNDWTLTLEFLPVRIRLSRPHESSATEKGFARHSAQ